ncbi:MAG TPA: GNAT family N-acetyltransferase [Elusimicrobiales bacterium]|nr:GNAT family N-acetyltransferase [Elusimicrobiales bacterium]
MMRVPDVKIERIASEDAGWKDRFQAFYSDCAIKELAPSQKHAYFAAYAGSELAGHSVIYFEKDRWVMDGLRVKPEFRQMGIAKRLTEARIRHAVENGAKEIWYSCDDGNLVTICCHLGFGFEKVCPSNHRCSLATAHWYRLKITPALLKKFPALKTTRPGKTPGARTKP